MVHIKTDIWQDNDLNHWKRRYIRLAWQLILWSGTAIGLLLINQPYHALFMIPPFLTGIIIYRSYIKNNTKKREIE